ncbi:MAG: hypothetical protein JWQ38_3747 [Flavipsychrobacter sp.]|nr:hypothetical protein [Flavipsychrobacter sp.]
MKKYRSVYWLLMPVVAFAILYFYFLPFETKTIYGDDLAFYREHFTLNSISDWVNCIKADQKLRPVTGLLDRVLISLFDKDMHKYYVFNIAIQAIITTVFALIIDLLLSWPLFAFFISMLIGTSRFAFYNVSQIYWGGPMEGLAMIFFLWMLYLLTKAFVRTGNTNGQNARLMLCATMIGNFAMYTHERYIVLFPFIMLVALLYPFVNQLTTKLKTIVCSASVLSMAANFLIKKYIYGFQFFVGTGGQHMKFSLATISHFLSDGLLSLIQVNTGGEMLVGNSFAISEGIFQVIAIALVLYMAVVFIAYTAAARKNVRRGADQYSLLYMILFLAILMLLNMLPAVATVRLEQRWLQAPFSVLILMLVVAFCDIRTYSATIRNVSFSVFVLLFILSDHNYLYKGAHKIYMYKAGRTAGSLRKAMLNGTIEADSTDIILIEDWWLYTEWVMQKGYLFNYYQGTTKRVRFFNDLYLHDNGDRLPISDVFSGTAQVLRVSEDTVTDVTDKYAGAK